LPPLGGGGWRLATGSLGGSNLHRSEWSAGARGVRYASLCGITGPVTARQLHRAYSGGGGGGGGESQGASTSGGGGGGGVSQGCSGR
jgi:hypothetical protein